MKLGHLADQLGVTLQGDADIPVLRLASLSSAGPADLAFAVSSRYRESLVASAAGAVITTAALAPLVRHNALVTADPYGAYARASWLLCADEQPAAGIHPTAILADDVEIGDEVSIGPGVVIDSGARLADRVVIGAHSSVGRRSRIGVGSRLFPRVTVYHDCRLGADCRLQSGAVIGAEGFGYAPDGTGWLPIHQTGGVRLGDRVHVGANTTIDRGAIDDTIIGDGVILDNQIQIAHNVEIGDNTAIAGCTGIAGSTRIGRHCRIGGACNIVGHIELADGVVLNAASLVTRSIGQAGHYGSGMPLQTVTQWRRTYAALSRLDALLRRVRRLEQRD